ncbi:hypothetical protein N2152v2_005018 [Parachlorella kessleri]
MSSTQQEQLCYSRLGAFCLRNVENCKLRGLVAALVVNDLGAARTILSNALATADFNHRVCTPFGGYRVFPAEAVISGPASEDEKCELISELHGLGASLDISWRDTSGEHTPLSKALGLRQFRLAGTLVSLGASPSTALLETSLLAACRFDPAVVKWLLDAGADVTVPAHHSPRHCPSGAAGSSSAVVTVLGKCGAELRVLHNLSNLQVMPATELHQQQALLQRTAHILSLLLAAGAPPFPCRSSGAASAAVRGAVGTGGRFLMPPRAPPYQPPPLSQQQHGVWSSLGYGVLARDAEAPLQVHGRETAPTTMHHMASPALSLAASGPDAPAASQLALPRLQSWQPSTRASGSPKLAQQPQQQQPQQQAQQQYELDWPEGLPSLDVLQLGPHIASPPVAPVACCNPPFGLSETEWDLLYPFATQVPQWSRRQHHLFPRPLRLAVRELLLIARYRGFPAAAAPQSRLGLEGAVHTQRLPEPPAETQAAETLQAMPPLLLPQDTVRDEAQQAQRLGRGCVQQGARPQRRHVEHEETDMQEQEVSPGRGKQREVQQRDPGQRDQGTRVVWLDDNVLDCVFRHLARVYYH